jgi:HPt (histidine-containing phosphotransfer) domain-containing protein
LNNTEPENSGATRMVDFDQLKSACDGDAIVMRELVDLYFQQAAEILAGLERAISGNAVGDVDHLSHKLAGSSLACGMSAVVPSLRQMEGGAKAGHLNGARELLADVNAKMKVIRTRVEDYLVHYRA